MNLSDDSTKILNSAKLNKEDDEEYIEGGNESIFYRVGNEENQTFLNMNPHFHSTVYLNQMTKLQQLVFYFMIEIKPLSLLLDIVQYPQKSQKWKKARVGRMTGSVAASAVGQQRITKVKKAAWDIIYKIFKPVPATIWGTDHEPDATQSYVNDLYLNVVKIFREQRKNGSIEQQNNHFLFRGQLIPIINIKKDPIIEIRHYALLIDPYNPWRGMSPDGVIFINDVAVGVLEVKCPYGSYTQQYWLYVNMKTYYYNQTQCELYLCNLYWPTIKWVDFVVWSPTLFTVETMIFDAEYFYSWYLPRELRFYFHCYLPILVERLLYLTRKEYLTLFPSVEQMLIILKKHFSL